MRLFLFAAFFSVFLSAGCREIDTESTAEVSSKLAGAWSFDATCTLTDKALLYDAQSWTQSVVWSTAFETCVAEELVEYSRCEGCQDAGCFPDPVSLSIAHEDLVELVIHLARSPNATRHICDAPRATGLIAAFADDQGFRHNASELIHWNRGFLNNRVLEWGNPTTDCRMSGRGPSLACRGVAVANAGSVVWHEAIHTHGFKHDQLGIRCRYDDPIRRAFHNPSHVMDTCIARVSEQSLEHCGYTACTAGGFSLVRRLGGSSCTCVEPACSDWNDADGDGVGDACDPCPDEFGTDGDGDGLCPSKDNCPSIPNRSQSDMDDDGLGDVCDPCPTDPAADPDGDGACSRDNCPAHFNAGQYDTDGDGLGNVCDPDIDGDGIDNAHDNCPLVANRRQEDADRDRIGDKCDCFAKAPGGGAYAIGDAWQCDPIRGRSMFEFLDLRLQHFARYLQRSDVDLGRDVRLELERWADFEGCTGAPCYDDAELRVEAESLICSYLENKYVGPSLTHLDLKKLLLSDRDVPEASVDAFLRLRLKLGAEARASPAER